MFNDFFYSPFQFELRQGLEPVGRKRTPKPKSPSIAKIGSISYSGSTSSGSVLMQRTRLDAAGRAYDVLVNVNPFAKIPFLRPYIYGLNLLTYGLILVDPLDRLE